MKGFGCLLAALALTGCATPWPEHMPPTSYSGYVYNEATKKNEPGILVLANRSPVTQGIRPGFGLVPIDTFPETLAETRTDRNGAFILNIKSGYAQALVAESTDHTVLGSLDDELEKSRDGLIIKIHQQ